MPPDPDPQSSTHALRSHLGRVLAIDGGGIPPEIHPADEMLVYPMQAMRKSAEEAVLDYFQVGNGAYSLLSEVVRWIGERWATVGPVLDFASGYGRVARFLGASGASSVTVSDILDGAVGFQRRVLGLTAFPSNRRPDTTELGGPYGFISVISLFSHLPESTFAGWLRRLTDALAPRGVLVFTTHGEEACARQAGRRLEPGAFVFEPASESGSLDPRDYGTSYVHPDRVRGLVERLPGITFLGAAPRGLNDHQDVYVVGRGQPVPPLPFAPQPVPFACIDVAQVDRTGRLRAGGWALTRPAHAPAAAVNLFVGEHLLGPATLGMQRPDLVTAFANPAASGAGWHADMALPGEAPEWISALAKDADGRRGFACRRIVRSP